MASSLFVSEVLKGITNGMVTGMQLRQQKEQAAQDAQFKQQQLDLQKAQFDQQGEYQEFQMGKEPGYASFKESYLQKNPNATEVESSIAWENRKLQKPDKLPVGEERRQKAFENTLVQQIRQSKEAQKIEKLNELETSIQNYRNLIATKVGSKYNVKVIGADRSELDTAFADVELKYKEAGNLGALTGPDLGLMKRALGEVTGFTGAYDLAKRGGKEGVLKGLDNTSLILEKNRERNTKNLKKFYPEHAELIDQLRYANEPSKPEKAQYDTDVMDYAKKHNISPEQANAIKQQRMSNMTKTPTAKR